jgi:hypothetical protein
MAGSDVNDSDAGAESLEVRLQRLGINLIKSGVRGDPKDRWHHFRSKDGALYRTDLGSVESWHPSTKTWEPMPSERPESWMNGSRSFDHDYVPTEEAIALTTGAESPA